MLFHVVKKALFLGCMCFQPAHDSMGFAGRGCAIRGHPDTRPLTPVTG